MSIIHMCKKNYVNIPLMPAGYVMEKSVKLLYMLSYIIDRIKYSEFIFVIEVMIKCF